MKKTYHITTFGCQMNARDSEKLAGILEQMGYEETDTEDADIVVINTCTVRENANERVYGHLGILKNLKKKHPGMIIAVCGCMMQEPDEVEKLLAKYRHVDLIFGTYSLWKFPALLQEVLQGNRPIADTSEETSPRADSMPVKRAFSYKSGVNIMYGCNNFCTYCIVPYVRGRERSRTPEEILEEIRNLVKDGVKEVMLLGQNVNSYGRTLEEPVSFARLLQMVCGIEGLERVRFMTSHPKDLSPELIEVMRTEPKICRHIHLPLQSGSSRILEKMNRHYTKEQYLDLVRRIRQAMPDISITTDIIVGFPGETEEDFKETMDVVEQAGFESAFTFIYSRRTGTPAADMPDQVSQDAIRGRFDRLLEQVQRISAEKAALLTGDCQPVLAEEINDHMEGYLTGRLSNNSVVHFPGSPELIGTIVPVKLLECRGFYYIGEMI